MNNYICFKHLRLVARGSIVCLTAVWRGKPKNFLVLNFRTPILRFDEIVQLAFYRQYLWINKMKARIIFQNKSVMFMFISYLFWNDCHCSIWLQVFNTSHFLYVSPVYVHSPQLQGTLYTSSEFLSPSGFLHLMPGLVPCSLLCWLRWNFASSLCCWILWRIPGCSGTPCRVFFFLCIV